MLLKINWIRVTLHLRDFKMLKTQQNESKHFSFCHGTATRCSEKGFQTFLFSVGTYSGWFWRKSMINKNNLQCTPSLSHKLFLICMLFFFHSPAWKVWGWREKRQQNKEARKDEKSKEKKMEKKGRNREETQRVKSNNTPPPHPIPFILPKLTSLVTAQSWAWWAEGTGAMALTCNTTVKAKEPQDPQGLCKYPQDKPMAFRIWPKTQPIIQNFVLSEEQCILSGSSPFISKPMCISKGMWSICFQFIYI